VNVTCNTECVGFLSVGAVQWKEAMTVTTYKKLKGWTDPKNIARNNDER
jgi:hypothetical protein